MDNIKDLYKNKLGECEEISRKYNDITDYGRNTEKISDLKDQIHKLQLEKEKNDFINLNLNDIIKKNNQKIDSQIEKSFDINFAQFNNEAIINKLIDKISEEEEYKTKCFKKIENFISNRSKNDNLVKHLNIILVGRTGIGKTTLLNVVLNYNEKECLKTDFGKPCTLGEPEYHESNKVPLLRIADSRGIETKGYSIKQLSDSVNKFIKDKLQSGNPDQFVHCIWYCINGTRFEDIEEETLEELSKIYKENSIPIIIVYTQAINEEHKENMEKIIKEKGKYDFMPVLAKQTKVYRYMIEPFGIKELKEISVKRARDAVKFSNYENYIIQTTKEIENQLKDINDQLDLLIEEKVKTKLNIMKDGKSDEEICDDLKNLLFYLISDNIYNKTRTLVSIKSENLIEEFSKNIITKELKESFEKRLKEYLDNESKILLQNILDNEKSQINRLSLYENDIKTIIDKSFKENYQLFYQKAWIFYIKKYFEEIFKLYAISFKKNSEKIYREILVHEDFKNCIKKLVKERFDEIEEKLKL